MRGSAQQLRGAGVANDVATSHLGHCCEAWQSQKDHRVALCAPRDDVFVSDDDWVIARGYLLFFNDLLN